MSYKSSFLVLSSMVLITFFGCQDPEPMTGPPATGNFTITIENVFEEKDYIGSGSFGAIDSGLVETFIVNASPGQHLSLIAGTDGIDDVFFGTPSNGIELYPGGSPLSADITSMIDLRDAGVFTSSGTNEMELISPGTSFWNVEDLIKVNVEHIGSTTFEVTIENITTNIIQFKRVGEGVWVVHDSDQMPLFEEGTFASDGLKSLAGLNSNIVMRDFLNANSGFNSALAPGAYAINDSLFFIGSKASDDMESLAEDGDPSGFTNIFNIPDGASTPGPISTGESYSFSLSATEGDYFSFASMLVETNDWFIGANYIPLFHNGSALSGEITSIMRVWDAGTEKDEFPGVGPNQAPRQSGANVGPDEDGVLDKELDESYNIPDIYKMVKVTLRVE